MLLSLSYIALKLSLKDLILLSNSKRCNIVQTEKVQDSIIIIIIAVLS